MSIARDATVHISNNEQGNMGQVVHRARGESIREGVPATFTVVSVTEVILLEYISRSHRQIILQSFVRG
jgi:hypothetical protein